MLRISRILGHVIWLLSCIYFHHSRLCLQKSLVSLIVFQGFSFPPEAGYPLDPDEGPKYFMMETHYNNPAQETHITDTSGIRVYYTPTLRRHDAGVLSVGMDPNWRHIIPPGQPEVISEGHCISACTKQAVPPRGIKVFAAALHTHLIGKTMHSKAHSESSTYSVALFLP
jgi:hypothetical protein